MKKFDIENKTMHDEHIVYAKILERCGSFGLFSLTIFLVIYFLNIIPSKIAVQDIPRYWGLPANDFLKISIGDNSLALNNLYFGNFWVNLPIQFLLLTTIICFISIIPVLFKKRDKLYLLMAVSQILILLASVFSV